MSYTVRYRVPLPTEMYDGMHQVIKDVPGGSDGMIVHLGWATPQGFEIIEVWQSKDALERFFAEVWPVIAERLGGGAIPPPQGEPFELLGIVVSPTQDRLYV